MLDAIQVTQSTVQITAVIHFTIPQMEFPKVMEAAIDELMATLKTQGITPAGPLFNHYLSMDSGIFDFDVGVPVSTPVTPAGRVKPGKLPVAKVARTTYSGPYTGLHNAWREFRDKARSQGLKPSGGIWECYVFGPESSPDPATWRTEFNQPLLG